MKAEARDALAQALAATLDDDRLSRGEERALREVVADLGADPAALAFVRHQAYDLAAARIEERPVEILAWLKRVDRIVDRAAVALDAERPVDRIAFSPGEDCRELVQETLRGARRKVDVCVFTLTDDRIKKTLLDLRRRGVAVRVLTDDDKQYDRGSDVGALRERGIDVRTDASSDHMHHKFAVVDEAWLVNGSFNWTRGAGRNHENVHVTDARAVVARYQSEFEKLWALFPDGTEKRG